MKIKVFDEVFCFGGNEYVKGDVFEVDDLIGNVIVSMNKGVRMVVRGKVSVVCDVKDDFDLNGDGVVDGKDASLAG